MSTVDPFETVKKLIFERRSVRKYLNVEIPLEELKEVLALSQRAPSSVNAQPYRVILVHTPEEKKKLGKLMLLNNEVFVNTSSATLIVCCDLDPLSHSHEITEMEMANGAPAEQAKMAETVLPRFFKSDNFFSRLYEAITGSYYKGEPMGIEGWSYKSAAFFMQQFVMLAQSKGWGTVYMGGFDAPSIKKAFGIPKTWDVCCTIAVGIPDESEHYHEHPRFPPNMVIYENEFGQPTKTEIPEVKQTYFWKSS